MEINVIGCPPDAWNYEFIVVVMDDGNYYYHSHHANGFDAEREALNTHGIVIHNVRIQGQRI